MRNNHSKRLERQFGKEYHGYEGYPTFLVQGYGGVKGFPAQGGIHGQILTSEHCSILGSCYTMASPNAGMYDSRYEHPIVLLVSNHIN